MVKTNSKIREAFRAVYNSLCDHEIVYPKERWRLLEIMDAALLEQPVRNCEVGTLEEQAKRFTEFCYKNRNVRRCCGDCPAFNREGFAECELAWAQMPYEANEKGEVDDPNG